MYTRISFLHGAHVECPGVAGRFPQKQRPLLRLFRLIFLTVIRVFSRQDLH